ncbi:TPA: hypothetical protein DDW35_10085 [Candidatus Sumerlaeota bacterium]|nr:hypothetical protein [Candidatus Sumerlaeota bacterium]
MLKLPVLYYHHICEPPDGTRSPSVYMETHRFAAQLRLLRRLGYQSISLDEFCDCVETGRQPVGRRVLITFDDGHEDNYINALPLLKEYGFTATIFVAAGLIGKRFRFNHTVDPQGDPLMTEKQIRDWLQQGMEIQSHGLNHGNLAQMPEDEVRRELTESRTILENVTGKPIRYFCYPFGSFRPSTLTLVEAAGYRAAFSTIRGKTHSWDERFCFCRIPVHHESSLFKVWQHLWIKSYARSKKRQHALMDSRP